MTDPTERDDYYEPAIAKTRLNLVAVEAYCETGRINECPPVVLASAHDAAMGELRKDSADTLAALNVAIAEGSKYKAERATLSAELEKARKDAARYRWLRDAIVTPAPIRTQPAAYIEIGNDAFSLFDGEDSQLRLDAAIDSAMAALSTHPGNGREGG